MREVKVSPQTAVIIENIATVRQIQQCLDGGEFRDDLVSLQNGFQAHVQSFFPDILWRKPKLIHATLELRLVPDEAWEVTKTEAIAISLGLGELLQPASYDERDDPLVSMYVPDKWEHFKSFAARMEEEVPKGWDRTNGRTELDERYPIWRLVPISNYAAGNNFDVQGFYSEAARAVGVLLDLKPRIDFLLNELRTIN